VEADWPDAFRVNQYIKGNSSQSDSNAVDSLSAFERFPRWMWRNVVVTEFIEWAKTHNQHMRQNNRQQVGFYGLDLYSMQSSRDAVVQYLDKVDPDLAKKARSHYACFDRFGGDTQTYGYKTGLKMSENCEKDVLQVLKDLLAKQADLMTKSSDTDEDSFFYAQQNAQLVSDAESYYRNMFVGVNTWNIRDRHMLTSLNSLIEYYTKKTNGPAKAVIWAHNSHLGDASHTSMKDRGEFNLGQLCREHFGMSRCFNIGFTTFTGTVTAAHNWDNDPEFMVVNNGIEGSYEKLLHDATAHMKMDMNDPKPYTLLFRSNTSQGEQNVVSPDLHQKLSHRRFERAIGVIYRPSTELFSHYFKACLPMQFDALIHVDTTLALVPLEIHPQWIRRQREHVPSAFPGIAHLNADKYDVGFFDPSTFDWTKENFINEKYHEEFHKKRSASA
jgi:erythromycin esterase-like protein